MEVSGEGKEREGGKIGGKRARVEEGIRREGRERYRDSAEREILRGGKGKKWGRKERTTRGEEGARNTWIAEIVNLCIVKIISCMQFLKRISSLFFLKNILKGIFLLKE